MPWVGLVLYCLHLPIILAAMFAGKRLLELPFAPENDPLLYGCGADSANGHADGGAAHVHHAHEAGDAKVVLEKAAAALKQQQHGHAPHGAQDAV